MNMKEVWKDIPTYEGRYQASNLGNIKSLNYRRFKTQKKLIFSTTKTGYKTVTLYNKGKNVRSVHRLIAFAFIPNPENKPYINHIDENKANNHIDNLEWVTPHENCMHGTSIQRSAAGKINGKHSKSVIQKDMSGKYIKTWPSMMEAERNGFCNSLICACCKGRIKFHKNYKWEYEGVIK